MGNSGGSVALKVGGGRLRSGAQSQSQSRSRSRGTLHGKERNGELWEVPWAQERRLEVDEWCAEPEPEPFDGTQCNVMENSSRSIAPQVGGSGWCADGEPETLDGIE
jgi:hypothetical protein